MNAIGRTADGTWEVGVRRTFPLAVAEAWELLPSLLKDDPAVGATRSSTPNKVMRLSYRGDGWERDSTLQLRVIAVASGVTIAIHHEGLPDAARREAMRQRWTAALETLGARRGT
jgi:hypothetical protein